MQCARRHLAWLGLMLGALWGDGGAKTLAQAPAGTVFPAWPSLPESGPSSGPLGKLQPAPAELIPLAELPAEVRDRVRAVVEQPLLSARGPVEEFIGPMPLYQWFLEHPDRAAQAWRRRGAPCLEIADRGNGRFGWTDPHGNDLIWETVYQVPGMHIWYAEGRARPGLMLPPLPGRAVLVLHYRERRGLFGETHIQHHADLFLQTDSKTAALVFKLFGPSLPRMAEQGLAQFCFFFSGMTQHLGHHPEQAEQLLK